MASASCISLLLVLVALATAESAQLLSPTFYATSCPKALDTIKTAVEAAVKKDPRMGASLLRLHFHDCFVQGCDASVLLSGNEQNAGPNVGSLRGFNIIDSIKTEVEAACNRTVVSCADILAVAARDSVVALGGPTWTVSLGRRDSTNASAALANSDLPSPASSRTQLEAAFSKKGLNTTDMVALSGAHTIGQAQCQNFRARLYGDANINGDYAKSLKANCPQAAGSPGDSKLAPLDTTTTDAFDNKYYSNLMSQKGLLHSDQVLFNKDTTDKTVRSFASDAAAFRSAFAAAMVKMGNIAPLTETQGQIRLSCSKVNS